MVPQLNFEEVDAMVIEQITKVFPDIESCG